MKLAYACLWIIVPHKYTQRSTYRQKKTNTVFKDREVSAGGCIILADDFSTHLAEAAQIVWVNAEQASGKRM